jgi:hypothetical protein
MRSLVASLDADAADLAAPMAPAALKEMHFRSYASAKRRTFDGKAIRRSHDQP